MTVPPESSEERYRAFIEQTSEGVWRCEVRDPIDVRLPVDQQIDAIYAHAWLAECNDAMARMYGLDSADQIVGVTIAELMPRDDPANLEYLGAFIRSGYRLTDAESHEIGNDGHSRFFLNNLVGIVRGGLLVRAWGSQRDITSRKAVESALRASEERYRALVMVDDSHAVGFMGPTGAGTPGERHGIAERPEALDVGADGAGGDLQALRELVTRPVAAGLEQAEQAEEPGRGFEHAASLVLIAEGSLP